MARNGGGNGDRADLKAADAVDAEWLYGFNYQLSHKMPRPGMSHEDTAVDIVGADYA